MGNEITTEKGGVVTTHVPEDATLNHLPDTVSDNIAVKTISNGNVITSHVPGKIMDEDITAPPLRRVIKPATSIKREEEAPPTQGKQLNERQVMNDAGGFSFEVCDMNRLRRYIVLGSETNTYYSSKSIDPDLAKAENSLANIKCVENLLLQKRHEDVLETIKEYSVSGRIAKEEPILQILSLCAGHEDVEIRRAALRRVVDICNIPTKLFKFLDLTQDRIDINREKNPPIAQRYKSDKKRKIPIAKTLETLNINDNKPKEPSESTDTSLEPIAKRKKEKEVPDLKKVNTIPRKSSGWGRMRRKAIAAFYVDENKDAARLLYLLTKYKQRHNWSHKTVIGYAHPKIVGENEATKNLVLRYCTRGYEKVQNECTELATKAGVDEKMSEIINYIKVIEDVGKLSPSNDGDEEKLLTILRTYGIRDRPKEFTAITTMNNDSPVENVQGRKCSIQIVREHLPTAFLNSKKVRIICILTNSVVLLILG